MRPLLKVHLVKKGYCVSDISGQEQELAEWFADHSLFYDQTQKDFKDKQLKNARIDRHRWRKQGPGALSRPPTILSVGGP